MEFGFARGAEIIRLQRVSCTSEIFQRAVRLETREREVRRERARFACEAERFERLFDGRGEFGELGSGLHAAPEHARLEFVGEETEDTEIHGDGFGGANRRTRGAAFRFQALAERGEGVAYFARQIEGDEKAHGSGSGSRGGGKKIIAAHGVERGLRSELANTFTIARKAISAFAGSVLVGEADVHQAHGLFRRTAAGTGDAGDADAESRAGAFADAVGEGERNFGADGAFRFDQTLRNADESGLQVVAVADYAAKKIGGAAGNVGEAFGEHAARAAFGDGDGGAIFVEDARDDFFEGFSIGGVEMFAESQSHAVGDFVEKFFGLGSIARPGTRMQLRAGGRG